MTFIRTPYIVSVSENARILAQTDEHIVAARQENQLVTAFHPKLNYDIRVHQYFLDMIKIREYNYEVTKSITMEQKVEYYNTAGAETEKEIKNEENESVKWS